MELDSRLPTSRPIQSGMCSGDRASVSSTTVGYRPTQTAREVLVSEGGDGASLPSPSKANQLPNELSIVRSWKSLNFWPSARIRCRCCDVSHASRCSALS